MPPVCRSSSTHERRYSAASLARDADVDPEIRRKTLGHADQAMTSHYTHIEAQAHRAAAKAVAEARGTRAVNECSPIVPPRPCSGP
jgi:integrase